MSGFNDNYINMYVLYKHIVKNECLYNIKLPEVLAKLAFLA